jgi:hypothetical protein
MSSLKPLCPVTFEAGARCHLKVTTESEKGNL